MFQGGEFAFVLIGQTVGMGILPAAARRPAQHRGRPLDGPHPARPAPLPTLLRRHTHASTAHPTGPPIPIDHASPVILAGFGRFGNFVGRLLRAQGYPAGRARSRRRTRRTHPTPRARSPLRRRHPPRCPPRRRSRRRTAAHHRHRRRGSHRPPRRRLPANTSPSLELLVRAKGMDHRLSLLNAGVRARLSRNVRQRHRRRRPRPAPARPAGLHRRTRRPPLPPPRPDQRPRPRPASRQPAAYVSLVRERVAALESLFANDPLDPARADGKAWDPPYLQRDSRE